MDGGNNLTYLVPGITVREGEVSRTICQNRLHGLLNVGRRLWDTAIKDPGKMYLKKGKTGEQSSRGKQNIEVYKLLKTFFTELKKETLLFATRFVHEKTGTTTRDDNPDDLMLAPHVSKHSIYARWCYSRGWKVTKKNSAKSTYHLVKDSYENEKRE